MKQLVDYRKEAWNCYRDSMCKYVFTWHAKSERFARMCPSLAKYQFDAFSAQGRLDVARALIDGELEHSVKLLDVVYRCQLCGGCDYVCGRVKEIQPGKIIQAMRSQLVADGQAPPAEFKPLMASLRDHLNPYGQPNANRNHWLKGIPDNAIDAATTEKAATTLLYVGCVPLRDAAAEAGPITAAKLLAKAGVDFGLLGEREVCCGNPSLRIGDQVQFIAFAKENIRMFNELGVEKIVCTCPYCYSTFRRDYPDVGEKMNFDVVHIVDEIARLIREKKLEPKKGKSLSVTYHDPCHLGRISGCGVSGTGAFTGIYDGPREILRSIPGVELTEMERIKDDAWCCGAGSWMRNAYPDFAQWTALERIAEAECTGAEGLVTYCAHCEENLGEALRSTGKDLKLYDLLDLVLEAL